MKLAVLSFLLLAIFESSLGIKGKKPPPPPVIGTFDSGAKKTTRWIYDEDCTSDRPPFGLGRWIEVTHEECPLVFVDPNFDFHRDFCR